MTGIGLPVAPPGESRRDQNDTCPLFDLAGPGRWLGVDLGAARIGLALSDPSRVLAMPLKTLAREGRGVRSLAGLIGAEAEAAGAVRVVVGLPLNMDGTDGPKAVEARSVAAALERQSVATGLQDERRSTVEAESQLRAAGRSARAQRAVVDQAAAVVILQAALDAVRPDITER